MSNLPTSVKQIVQVLVKLTDEELVRAFLTATEGMSQEAAARLAPGVSQKDVSRWKRGDFSWLSGKKRLALERFLEKRSGGLGGPGWTSEEPMPSPDYESLGIDIPGYDRLLPRPRRIFDEFMVNLIARGLGRDDLQELGAGALAPISHLDTLYRNREVTEAESEEDQMMVLDRMIPVLVKLVARSGR